MEPKRPQQAGNRRLVSGAARVVEVVASVLVDHPESIEIDENVERDTTHVTIACDAEDVGKLIGRQGRTASAIRTLAELVDDGEERRVSIHFRD